MDIWSILENKIKGKNITIVYPESNDERILGAAARHAKDGLLVPVLVGEVEATKALAKEKGIDLGDIEIIDPKTYADFDTMVASFVERRKGKVDEEKARTMLLWHYACLHGQGRWYGQRSSPFYRGHR